MNKLLDYFSDLRHLALFVAGVSFASLCFAWILQYGFNKLPCPLCYMQRYPYMANCLIGLLAAVLAGKFPRATFFILLSAVVAFVAGIGISGFHVGVEFGWWKGLSTCGLGGGPPANATLEELKKFYANAPIVHCEIAGWVFLGISLTAWNFLLSVFLAGFTFINAFKGYQNVKTAPKA